MKFETSPQFALNDAPPGRTVPGDIVAFVPRSSPKRRVALIGGFRPRKCGIATFTTDIFEQLGQHHPEIAIDLHVIDSAEDRHDYP
jgi:hypothetical protein